MKGKSLTGKEIGTILDHRSQQLGNKRKGMIEGAEAANYASEFSVVTSNIFGIICYDIFDVSYNYPQ
jgi:hypothetical protein